MSKKFLIVGSGFYGATCARELTDAGHSCLVIDKRTHIGGNCYTRYIEEADCHEHHYGAHIFHTNSEKIWKYINRFASFNHYVNRVKVSHKDKIYSFPINLFTLYQLFGVKTPEEAKACLAERKEPIENPKNMEEWCLANVGREIYETFIEGYSLKQWARHPRELPASIIKRVPIRLTFDDNYFNDRYQGIPIGGYTSIFEKMLDDIPVELNTDFHRDRETFLSKFDHVIFTGPIDSFFDYSVGHLEYRSLRFDHQLVNSSDYQGNAVINHTESQVPYTRTYEHKHFDMNFSATNSAVTYEYPDKWEPGKIEIYPVNTDENQSLFEKYQNMTKEVSNVTFGGRLGQYRYYDMHQVIASALEKVKSLA
ncbi:MAG: UDP-galactopyranose mutase [Opitutae bacterium]|nr:UDP-galactopyranose mutase [Opitutae bacterium]